MSHVMHIQEYLLPEQEQLRLQRERNATGVCILEHVTHVKAPRHL